MSDSKDLIPSELDLLIGRVLDESASAEDRERLQSLLHGDPDACETYLDAVVLHSRLERELGGAVEALPQVGASAGPVAAGTRRGRDPAVVKFASASRLMTVARYAAVALIAVGIALAGQRWLQSRHHASDTPVATASGGSGSHGGSAIPPSAVLPSPPAALASASPAAEYVATLVSARDATWSGGARRFPGQRLAAGPLALEKGLAELRFDGGATLVLQGPAMLNLETIGRGRLLSGTASVYAPQEAYGFTLNTAARDFVDLGTSFSVSVGSDATEVHVHEGQVESYEKSASAVTTEDPPGTATPERLSAGDARRFDANAPAGRAVPLAGVDTTSLIEGLRSAADPGRVLAYEPFAYSQSDLPAVAAAGGFGWAGPWSGRYIADDVQDPDARLQMAPERSLAAPIGVSAPMPGLLSLPADRIWRLRKLQTPIDLSGDRVYYLSFRCRRLNPPVKPGVAELSISFRSEQRYWDYQMGFRWMGDGYPCIIGNRGKNAAGAARLDPSKTYLFVGKIVAGSDQPDQLFLKIYDETETIDPLEPARWSVVGPMFDDAAKLDLLIIASRYCDQEMDEIRMGTTWTSVTSGAAGQAATVAPAAIAPSPIAPSPVAPATALASTSVPHSPAPSSTNTAGRP